MTHGTSYTSPSFELSSPPPTRSVSPRPPPPTGSATSIPNSSRRLRYRLTRTTRLPEGAVGAGAAASPAEVDGAEEEDEEDAEGPAAKKKRSRASTATCVTGCGNEKVDRREAGEVDRSQICGVRFGVEERASAGVSPDTGRRHRRRARQIARPGRRESAPTHLDGRVHRGGHDPAVRERAHADSDVGHGERVIRQGGKRRGRVHGRGGEKAVSRRGREESQWVAGEGARATASGERRACIGEGERGESGRGGGGGETHRPRAHTDTPASSLALTSAAPSSENSSALTAR